MLARHHTDQRPYLARFASRRTRSSSSSTSSITSARLCTASRTPTIAAALRPRICLFSKIIEGDVSGTACAGHAAARRLFPRGDPFRRRQRRARPRRLEPQQHQRQSLRRDRCRHRRHHCHRLFHRRRLCDRCRRHVPRVLHARVLHSPCAAARPPCGQLFERSASPSLRFLRVQTPDVSGPIAQGLITQEAFLLTLRGAVAHGTELRLLVERVQPRGSERALLPLGKHLCHSLTRCHLNLRLTRINIRWSRIRKRRCSAPPCCPRCHAKLLQ